MAYLESGSSNLTDASDQVTFSTTELPWPKWLSCIISSRNNQLTLLGHLLLAGGFLGLVASANVLMLHYGSLKHKEWLPAQQMERVDMEKRIATVEATDAEKARMIEQLEQVLWRINVHGKVMGFFYRLNFVSLATLCFGAGVGSISLFFISKHGWERINNAVISIFILSSGVVFLHGNLMLTMQYQENITLNRHLFEKYSEIKNIILSYWATQASDPESLTAAEFIHKLDATFMEFDDIALSFDHDQAALLRRSMNLTSHQEASKLSQETSP